MEWEIKPYEGIGEIRFGMSREAARRIVGESPSAFYRSGTSGPTDAFYQTGLMIEYSADDLVVFAETTPKCDPTFRGIHFSRRTAENVMTEMRGLGFEFVKDKSVYQCDEAGVSFWTNDKKIESVAVYMRGYYD